HDFRGRGCSGTRIDNRKAADLSLDCFRNREGAMWALVIGLAIGVLVGSGGAAARAKGAKPARSVQLITMTASAPESGRGETAEAPATSAAVSPGPRPPMFQVHNLSRQWVKF